MNLARADYLARSKGEFAWADLARSKVDFAQLDYLARYAFARTKVDFVRAEFARADLSSAYKSSYVVSS